MPQNHAQIDEHVEKENTHHAIAIDARETMPLTLGQQDETYHEIHVEHNKKRGAKKAEFLAYGTENEVGILLGNIFQFGLSAFQITLAQKSAGANGNLRLIDIITRIVRIVYHTQKDLGTHLLMWLQDFFEKEVGGVEKGDGHNNGSHKGKNVLQILFQRSPGDIDQGKRQAAQQDVSQIELPEKGVAKTGQKQGNRKLGCHG